MSEDEFQDIVEKIAEKYGWKFYHAPYKEGRRVPGFPDLVIVRDRILFRELKTARGQLTLEQEKWIRRLQNAGSDAKVWRPDDIDEIEAELSIEREEELEEREEHLIQLEKEMGINFDHLLE